jgi:small subunit ribosomal protein S15
LYLCNIVIEEIKNKEKSVMYLTPEVKKNIFKEYGKSEFDTGSIEGQVALFTFRIQHLTEHVKKNKQDKFTERSLVQLVGQRRKLLDYLKREDIERYRAIIKKLSLRK